MRSTRVPCDGGDEWLALDAELRSLSAAVQDLSTRMGRFFMDHSSPTLAADVLSRAYALGPHRQAMQSYLGKGFIRRPASDEESPATQPAAGLRSTRSPAARRDSRKTKRRRPSSR